MSHSKDHITLHVPYILNFLLSRDIHSVLLVSHEWRDKIRSSGAVLYHVLQKLENMSRLSNSIRYQSDIVHYMPRQPNFDSEMRGTLINWMNDVCRTYSPSQTEVFFASVSMLDRVLSSSTTIERHTFQLLGIVCLRMSFDLYEQQPPSTMECIYLCSNIYTERDFDEIQEYVLSVLETVHVPTIDSCLDMMIFELNIAYAAGNIMNAAEESQFVYELCTFPPSLVAASIVFNLCPNLLGNIMYITKFSETDLISANASVFQRTFCLLS